MLSAGCAGAAAFLASGQLTTKWQPPGVAYRPLSRAVCAVLPLSLVGPYWAINCSRAVLSTMRHNARCI